MKILNLYAGIGGNRKLWGDKHDITAVENNTAIANIYGDLFPSDNVVIGDAHKYLLNNFKDFDFIWSSPPCPTHSRMRFKAYCNGKGVPLFPDLKLYEEILFLQQYTKSTNIKYIVENVKSWYTPLVEPQLLGRHYFWSNVELPIIKVDSNSTGNNKGMTLHKKMLLKGYNITNWHNYKGDKRTLLNNCVEQELGLHILDCVINQSLIK